MTNRPINSLTLAQMRELRNSSASDYSTVLYGEHCIVGHNLNITDRSVVGSLFMNPTRMNIVIIALCLEGDVTIRCDMQEIRLTSNMIFISKPGSILQLVSGNSLRMSVLITDDRFNDKLNVSFQKLMPHFTQMEKLSAFPITPQRCKRVDIMLALLQETIQEDPSEMYYHESVQSLMKAVAYEVISLVANLIETKEITYSPSNREEEYLRQFMNLLGVHFREQHMVQFYADKVHITPKYLSSIITHLTGRSPSKWIDQYIMTEARSLLLNTDLSIQEISYQLNFANQSFFGKYFKAHMGVSPTNFRK